VSFAPLSSISFSENLAFGFANNIAELPSSLVLIDPNLQLDIINPLQFYFQFAISFSLSTEFGDSFYFNSTIMPITPP